jgi:hypothetical protein
VNRLAFGPSGFRFPGGNPSQTLGFAVDERRLHLKDRLSGVLGCTHLTELAQVLPTAAIQAFADDAMANRSAETSTERPYELDRCHALRLDGPAVETYYPRWALKAVPG